MSEVGRITLTASGLSFSALQFGRTESSVVLCLHGFPDGPGTFRHQFAPLVGAGHRVIAPTLRGYEPSSQPADGDYSLVALADDVVGWIDDLGLERVHLVGHDWGAAIVNLAATRHSSRVLTATALAVPPLPRIPDAIRRVPRQLQRSWYMTFFQLPWLPERALAIGDGRFLRRLWRNWSPAHTMSEHERDALREQFERPGVISSALAYYRQNATPPILLGLRSTPATEIAEVPVPMLIVYGTDDGCMDRRLYDHTVRPDDFPAGVQRLEVADAGHFVHIEQPDVVNRVLIEHLGS